MMELFSNGIVLEDGKIEFLTNGAIFRSVPLCGRMEESAYYNNRKENKKNMEDE